MEKPSRLQSAGLQSPTRLSDFTFTFTLAIKHQASLMAQTVKASAYNVGDPGSIPGSGRSPGEGDGNPLQYSCLENPMDRGAWLVINRGVAGVGY